LQTEQLVVPVAVPKKDGWHPPHFVPSELPPRLRLAHELHGSVPFTFGW